MIHNGSLLINHYGGSSWRWSSVHRFQFRKSDWYLIGVTTDWFKTMSDAGREYLDINLITGDFIEIVTDELGVETKTTGKKERSDLITLIDFNINDNDE